MDIIDTAKSIQRKIALLEKGRDILKERSEEKAKSMAEYDRVIALTIIKLKNGQVFELDGEKVQNPPSTLIEKLAKGICWKEKLAMERGEAEYKNAIVGMDAIKAEMNGYQSIHKNMTDM